MIKKIFKILTAILTAAALSCPVIASFAADSTFAETFVSKITPLRIIVCLLIGFFIAFIIVSTMRSKLYSVSYNDYAGGYLEYDSSGLTYSKDTFEYDRVEKTALPDRDDD
jgi:hypothetical protein